MQTFFLAGSSLQIIIMCSSLLLQKEALFPKWIWVLLLKEDYTIMDFLLRVKPEQKFKTAAVTLRR